MDEAKLQKLLLKVKTNNISVQAALLEMKNLHYDDLGFAKVDMHRQLRQGFSEVVYCEGKTTEQIVAILRHLAKNCEGNILASRATRDIYEAVSAEVPESIYSEQARLIILKRGEQARRGHILVVSAGTSDLPVAEEAALTVETMGSRVERLYDTGVAGIHRLLKNSDKLLEARVLIVVAGMDGALPSVVGSNYV